jgi:hypothetical protein
VEWNNINKTQSWITFSALSLSNPTPIIPFTQKNQVIDNMSFCHPVQYCKSKTEVETAEIQKVSTSTTCAKYKFDSQVPKGIKNAIYLYKENGKSL